MTNNVHPAYRGPWPRIRKQILQRDNHTCQIQSPKCTGTATAVDHIIPITQGGPWWDPTNLRATCTNCNNKRINRNNKDRWQTANTHITLIVGPPCAGKTTHVQQHAQPGDLIIDYDQIKDAIQNHGAEHKTGGTPKQTGANNKGDALHQAANAARNALLKTLREGKAGVPRAWIISANPQAETIFPYHKVIVIDPGLNETLRRVKEQGKPPHWERLVQDWYQVRAGGDSRIIIKSRNW